MTTEGWMTPQSVKSLMSFLTSDKDIALNLSQSYSAVCVMNDLDFSQLE